jgi:protein TonB
VYQVADPGVTAPRVVHEERPVYPRDTLSRRVEGRIRLRAIISDTGVPERIVVTEPLEASLDREAVRAASAWRFEPATRNGRPVRVEVELEFAFRVM